MYGQEETSYQEDDKVLMKLSPMENLRRKKSVLKTSAAKFKVKVMCKSLQESGRDQCSH